MTERVENARQARESTVGFKGYPFARGFAPASPVLFRERLEELVKRQRGLTRKDGFRLWIFRRAFNARVRVKHTLFFYVWSRRRSRSRTIRTTFVQRRIYVRITPYVRRTIGVHTILFLRKSLHSIITHRFSYLGEFSCKTRKPCGIATGIGFTCPRVMFLPIVQGVPVRGFVNPHAKAGVEKLLFLSLPVRCQFDVFPVHAGKVPVRTVHSSPRPQDLKRAYPFKPKTTGSLLCLRVLPEPDG